MIPNDKVTIRQRELIRKPILGMEQPFTRPDLFHRVAKLHGIQNRALVLDVMDELFDNEAITGFPLNNSSKYILRAREAVQSIRPSRLRKILKILGLICLTAMLVISFVCFRNKPADILWVSRGLLLLVAIIVLLIRGKRTYIPSCFELHFYPDYLILYRPQRRYNTWTVRREHNKIYYSDISQCVYFKKSKKLQICGKIHAVWYGICKNGLPSMEPICNRVVESSICEINTHFIKKLDIKEAIEKHAPINIIVKNR